MAEEIKTQAQWLSNFIRIYGKEYGMTAHDVAVAHALASYCQYKDHCHPSQMAIQDYCAISIPNISRVTKHLENLGIIRTVKQPGSRTWYFFLIPHIPDSIAYAKNARELADNYVYEIHNPYLVDRGLRSKNGLF